MTSKFRRLLSNLPFNPSLIEKVAFYSKRLRRETSIRRLGLVFLALAMFVQTFAVLSPPQASIAQSGNDLIGGGFSSQGQAISVCQNNIGNFRDIAGHFNISCDNISAARTVTIRSNDFDGQLYSMGRIAYGKAGETPVTINGATYWLRYLWSWDSWGAWSTYTTLQGTSREGRTFFILYDCGNFVFIGLPPPPAPTPPPAPPSKPAPKPPTTPTPSIPLEFSKQAANNTQNISDANGTTAKAGDVIIYTLSVKNKDKVNIDKFVVQENISDILDYADVVDLKGGTEDSRHVVSWPSVKIKAGATVTQQFIVKIKDPVPQTPVSSSDPGHFDLIMTNIYGNTVSIKLPPSIMKTTETIVSTLPNTGPGTSLLVGFAITTVVAYFFARTRLMKKELELVRSEYNNSGSA